MTNDIPIDEKDLEISKKVKRKGPLKKNKKIEN